MATPSTSWAPAGAAEKPGAQLPRLLFGAPSRRTRMRLYERIGINHRHTKPATRALLAAPGAGALPISIESFRFNRVSWSMDFHDTLNEKFGTRRARPSRIYFTSALQNFSIRSRPFSMFAMLVA
jgi:hypothetical protein